MFTFIFTAKFALQLAAFTIFYVLYIEPEELDAAVSRDYWK